MSKPRLKLTVPYGHILEIDIDPASVPPVAEAVVDLTIDDNEDVIAAGYPLLTLTIDGIPVVASRRCVSVDRIAAMMHESHPVKAIAERCKISLIEVRDAIRYYQAEIFVPVPTPVDANFTLSADDSGVLP